MKEDNENDDRPNLLVGVAGVAIASFVWGSCFIVCKGYDMPSDGVHFSFLMSIGILLVGFASLCSSSAVENGDMEVVFSPLGLLGGAFWCCGNFLTVPIITRVGLGIGLALWAGTNMIVAFVIGAVGLESIGLDLPKESLKYPNLGVIGVLLAIMALVLFAAVKPAVESSNPQHGNNDNGSTASNQLQVGQLPSSQDQRPESEPVSVVQPLLQHFEVSSSSSPTPSYQSYNSQNEEDNDHEARPNTTRHHISAIHIEDDDQGRNSHKNASLLGICMAIMAGTLYGFQFVPLTLWNAKTIRNGHIFDQPLPSDTIRSLRFFFSQFAGIFLTAFAGFVLYCIFKRNRPKLVPTEATLPSIVCGAVWAIGCAGAMLATSGLGNAVGFPLLLNCSFLVNSAWSILYFKEIQGKRNLRLFGTAFLLNVISSVFISLAKGQEQKEKVLTYYV